MAETIRFEGLSLPVSDVARSIEFYRLLDFEIEISRPMSALLRKVRERLVCSNKICRGGQKRPVKTRISN